MAQIRWSRGWHMALTPPVAALKMRIPNWTGLWCSIRAATSSGALNCRSRSPVLCILDQGCSIARHETQGTEVMPELSALAGEVGRPRGEVGRPRGEVEGARGHCRSSPSATRCGEEGFLDLVQATVF